MAWLCSEANMPGTPGVTEHLQFSSHPLLKPFLKLAGGMLASRMVSGVSRSRKDFPNSQSGTQPRPLGGGES